jgi:two-component system response regulator HydG
LAFDFPGIIGPSPRMQEIFELLTLVAASDANVLLLGETGTGKEIIAHAIHNNSRRRDGPFVVVNCAALPETLLESELFGHERGAFTGAFTAKQGRFSRAHLGSVFLDEIGELTPAIQAKILRVLQTREFEPLGGNRTRKVDVRIITATNRQLAVEVREGRFREDLYYRLNVVSISLPPLRDRLEDLPLLAQYFLKRFNEKNNRHIKAIAPEVLEVFNQYPWPGNIRELENVIERGIIFCREDTLTLKDLPPSLQDQTAWGAQTLIAAGDSEPSLLELERELILRTLQKVDGDRQQAAYILGISIEELNFKLKAYRGES